jgi:hypothetical protein
VLLLAACARETPLATMEGRSLTEGDFQRHLAERYPADEQQQIRESSARRQIELDRWFDLLAISEKARRLRIDREPRFHKAVELMEMKTLAHLLTEQHRARIESITRVSDDEVQRFYDEHKHEYSTRPSFTARQILIHVRGNPAFPERGWPDPEAKSKARQALRQLRAGKGWDAVARAFSEDLSNNQKGGLIRDGQLGLFAPEVEQAVRTQELGQPGDLLRSVFGYHILQVESRNLEASPEPFAQVAPLIRQRLASLHAEQAHKAFVEPIAVEMGLKVIDAGMTEGSLLDESAVAADEVLAAIAGRKIRESDFRWFLKDAFPVSQRAVAFSRPGARKNLLSSFLDQLVLAAKARKQGMDKSPDFIRQRATMKQTLLQEFVQEHDKAGAFCQCQQTPEERQIADRRYFDQVRAEVGLKVLATPVAR